ncbi:carbon monoxide dehydrogenase [Pseudonocardia sp. CNS-139]|nr:carbon monoxide dehydrogenase [Pseudonocardia sp. CNS-139]
MQLENKFTIDAPIEKAWEALNTPETVAPCFPGATLQEYEGDSFTGTVKVKLGPISLTYKGKGTYVSRDDENHKVVIEATGRDSRGNGTASATVTGSMVADGPNRTAVTMVTDMTITGRPAQFGRGVISDVADKIIGQFSACVASRLAPAEEPAAEEQPAASAAEAGGAGANNGSGSAVAAATATATVAPATPAAAPRPVAAAPMRSEVDAIDLLDTAGAPVLRRLAPVAAGLVLLIIVLLIRRSRSSS